MKQVVLMRRHSITLTEARVHGEEMLTEDEVTATTVAATNVATTEATSTLRSHVEPPHLGEKVETH